MNMHEDSLASHTYTFGFFDRHCEASEAISCRAFTRFLCYAGRLLRSSAMTHDVIQYKCATQEAMPYKTLAGLINVFEIK